MKSLAQRRQSAPSLVLSKALTKSRTSVRESCFSPISPETCPLVQSFICPSRTFLMDGHVQLKTGLQTQERHLFLFSDILVVAKPKSHLHFKLKSQARLCDMWTASCLEEVCEGSTDLEKSFVLGWPTTNCVASFSSIEQKEKWLTFLQSRIKEEKEKDYPKSIPLKIIAKDIGSCAYSKTLTINNTDTASDIVLMALQQLGINGSEKEYQLWVNSGREDAPYPLIGHEYPFGIKMSHIRDTLPQTQESKDCVCPLEVQEAILIEQLPRERQCQFVIKPRRLATGHELNECSQKPLKRKRSTINWAFWRGAETPPSPTSAQGKLFGHPLPDKLPKPIFDMLSFLNQEGPFTEGIFRRSASAKSCRELKEKLDSGAEVNLLSESILVIASVLKDFLRNIPGSVFSSQLCDQWVSLMDEGNDEEKIKSTHRLMEQLPGANVMLLRYLFGVLHSIERQSEDNKMTAFNLAVCIGPSLLWLPAATNSWTEEEFTMKASVLIEFMIQNGSRIFGDEINYIFAAMMPQNDNQEDSSDLSSVRLHDSSSDSLENELNDCANLNKKEEGSKEVVSLSDIDLDLLEAEDPQIRCTSSGEHSESESGYSSTPISDALEPPSPTTST
ncbi:rho GTPase-activating protein 20 isoform X3 [Podarcis raffonei]|nr:rho GTPase-activating protein 20 isoform X3 [Podarcis raffonei]XP_053241781.1 rho GTPase-activating protein 20 isoform X3 [Podarcis raffonei]XP_053241782.1 rho GTPase-activating protein 20 isoform X3 [Podarcis raffonei]